MDVTDEIKVTYSKDELVDVDDDNVVFSFGTGNITSVIDDDFGYRYEGSDPNNFVWFNNEFWRIIGVFETENSDGTVDLMTKIVRKNAIGSQAWDSSSTNNWSTSNLQQMLNDYYFNQLNASGSGFCGGNNCDFRQKGLDENSRSMVENVIWKLGGSISSKIDVFDFYKAERSFNIYNENPLTWTGKVALLYPSDHGFSYLEESCPRTLTLYDYYTNSCSGSSWLYGFGKYWLLPSKITSGSYSFYASYNESIDNTSTYIKASIVPTLYLKSSVNVLDGDGTRHDPYQLGYNE